MRQTNFPFHKEQKKNSKFILTFIASIAAQYRASILLWTLLPVRLACQTQAVAGACCTANRTCHAFGAFLVRIETGRTCVQAATVQRESSAAARNALRLGGSVAGGAGGVTRGAAGITKITP